MDCDAVIRVYIVYLQFSLEKSEMKKLLLFLCMAGALQHGTAQEDKHGHLEKSVFSNSRLYNQKSAPKDILEKAGPAFKNWNVTTDNVNGTFVNLFGNGIDIKGATYTEKAMNCMDMLSSLGIYQAEWKLIREYNSPKATHVRFEKTVSGHKVAMAFLAFKFVNNKLIRVEAKTYAASSEPVFPTIAQNAVAKTKGFNEDIAGGVISEKKIATEWEWFPIPTGEGYKLHAAYAFNVKGKTADGEVYDMDGYVDATNGNLLYRTSNIRNTFDVTVKGNVNQHTTVTDEPLANMRIFIDGYSFTTDANGYANAAFLPAIPTYVNFNFTGDYVDVINFQTGKSNIDMVVSTGTTIVVPSTTFPAVDRKLVNTYYHTNRVHDFMKSKFPSFTTMDFSMVANVDRNDFSSPYCNAFYRSWDNTINFLPAGGGCPSYTELDDVIYHEYGHGISFNFYNTLRGSGMNNGALNEGNSDIWAIGITKDGKLGIGARGANTVIRRYDQAPKVYPQDITGEVHADGEIIAGAWYDVAINLNDFDKMSNLFAATYYDLPDGPSGTEGDIYLSVLISALEADDDDGNLNNGTPNVGAIVKGFARHGITLLNDMYMNHFEVANQPANTPINVEAEMTFTPIQTGYFKNAKVFFRNRTTGSAWDSVEMSKSSSIKYAAQIPGQPAASIVEYYFVVNDVSDVPVRRLPTRFDHSGSNQVKMTLPYQFAVGVHQRTKSDFEADNGGWTLGDTDDNAAAPGRWTWGEPVGTTVTINNKQIQVQPGKDHTTERSGGVGKCLVTGNAASGTPVGMADVDNGKTTALTPIIDLSGYGYPMIEYYRWYSNNTGSNPENDFWQVQIRDASGGIWRYVENTTATDNTWRRKIFGVREFLTSQKVIVRFIASDETVTGQNQGQSTVEAAIDDFTIYDAFPTSVGNNAGLVKADIYPNPATDVINITLPAGINGSLGLYDATGRLIAEQELNAQTTQYSINTTQISAGVYTVIVKGESSTQVKKVTITH
jgi:hypothetical protein